MGGYSRPPRDHFKNDVKGGEFNTQSVGVIVKPPPKKTSPQKVGRLYLLSPFLITWEGPHFIYEPFTNHFSTLHGLQNVTSLPIRFPCRKVPEPAVQVNHGDLPSSPSDEVKGF